jgi:hypothetical protein
MRGPPRTVLPPRIDAFREFRRSWAQVTQQAPLRFRAAPTVALISLSPVLTAGAESLHTSDRRPRGFHRTALGRTKTEHPSYTVE